MVQNDTSEKPLSAKQEKFIAALVAGHTIVTSAAAAGVTNKTAHLWLKQPHIQSAYRLAQKHVFDASLNTLCLGVEDALKALRRHIQADVEPTAATQIAAARLWTEQAIAIHKMGEIEERFHELEEVVKQLNIK